MSNPPHARAFDLPNWPCPPRVRDIPSHEGSWGHVRVTSLGDPLAGLVIDELGFLWANGDVPPVFDLPNGEHSSPGAVTCWTPEGLGVWVHPKSMKFLPQISRLDMQSDQWIPIAVALAEMPAAAKEATQ